MRPLITAVGPAEPHLAELWPTAGAFGALGAQPPLAAGSTPSVVDADIITSVPWRTSGDTANGSGLHREPPVSEAPEPDVEENTRLDPVDVEGVTLPRAEGPRVVLDTGQVVMLDRPVLVGRDPAPRPGYEDAHLVAVDDVGRSVSKTHLVVAVVDGRVVGMDLYSTNGTSTGSAVVGWTSRPGGQPFDVGPDTVVRFGARTLQVTR